MEPVTALPPLSADDVVHLARPAGKRILDVCCGDGELGAALLAAGAAEVAGLDACARGLARSRLNAVYQIDPDAAPELPYPDGYFEVLLVEDLSRLLVIAPTLRHLRRWLSDEGRLVCVVPNATHEAALSSLLTEGRLPPSSGARPSTPAAALDVLATAGFQVEDELILVRTEAGAAAPGIGAAMAALGVDPARAADVLTLVRAIMAARPGSLGFHRVEPLADPWRGSRPVKVLVAPDLAEPRDRWLEVLAEVSRGLSGSENVTLGVALPLPHLSPPPAPLQAIASGVKVDLVCIEAPVDRSGWERLLAGASFWMPTSEHSIAAEAARRVGTQIQLAV
jgi:SAM-dependent methyltransferase